MSKIYCIIIIFFLAKFRNQIDRFISTPCQLNYFTCCCCFFSPWDAGGHNPWVWLIDRERKKPFTLISRLDILFSCVLICHQSLGLIKIDFSLIGFALYWAVFFFFCVCLCAFFYTSIRWDCDSLNNDICFNSRDNHTIFTDKSIANSVYVCLTIVTFNFSLLFISFLFFHLLRLFFCVARSILRLFSSLN